MADREPRSYEQMTTDMATMTDAEWEASDLAADMVRCTTCDGSGQSLMRGDSHETYDDPDYWDACGICGGGGWLRASMFADAPDNDEGDEPDAESRLFDEVRRLEAQGRA